jgi:hypothetical protein
MAIQLSLSSHPFARALSHLPLPPPHTPDRAAGQLHPTEIVPEAWLKVGTGGCLKRLPG